MGARLLGHGESIFFLFLLRLACLSKELMLGDNPVPVYGFDKGLLPNLRKHMPPKQNKILRFDV